MMDDTAAISVIVPVYLEAANIEPLVRRTFAALLDGGIEGELIFVDDDSDDATVEIVHRLAVEYPIRVCLRRHRRGLASAVLHGFAQARNPIFVVMDADLQHPPEAIPELIRPIADDQADMVFGSRYASGGRVAHQWSTPRRIASYAAALLARPLLPLHDPLSGFFALHRDIWLRATGLRATGFKIGLELAVRARCRRCIEVPIVFSTRHTGRSKLRIRQQLQYLGQLIHLYGSPKHGIFNSIRHRW